MFFFSLFDDDDINSDCTLPNKPTVVNDELQEMWSFFFWRFPSRSVLTYKHNTPENNTTLYFVHSFISIQP